MSSAEAEHYIDHYGGALRLGTVSLAEFEASMLQSGQRYGLVVEDLERGFAPARVIEIGCGGAEALLILSSRFKADSWEGYDIAVQPQQAGNVAVCEANLNNRWPIEDGAADGIIAMMVIEHLFDPFFAFKEIKRTLSPGGRAWVNLPLVTSLSNRLRALAGLLPITSIPYKGWFAEESWDGFHLHYFSVSSIRDLAAHCGLKVRDMRGVGRLHRLKTAFPTLLAAELTFSLEHL